MMTTCGQPETVPIGGGVRLARGCPRFADDEVDGQKMCRTHADAARYQHREFERLMENATRHVSSMSVFGKGVWCSCGAFVKFGDAHPFGVPSRIEDARADVSSVTTTTRGDTK